MSNFEALAKVSELPPGGRRSVFVDDIPALLIRVGDEVFVVEDNCTHDGQPLTNGPLVDGGVMCPRHGARFDLQTGKAMCMPATEAIRTFDVEIRDGVIFASPDPRRTDSTSQATVSCGHTAFSEAGCSSPGTSATLMQISGTKIPAGEATASDSTSAENAPEDGEIHQEELIEALRQVIDPELMINVVDLGLVYGITQEGTAVLVDMTLTSPACPAGPQIVSQAKLALERVKGVSSASIKLVMSPPWTPDRMTDEARDHLGIF